MNHESMTGLSTNGLSMMDMIVLLAGAFAVAFFAAWLLSPRLRAWIERPKYSFQSNVQSYDEEVRRHPE